MFIIHLVQWLLELWHPPEQKQVLSRRQMVEAGTEPPDVLYSELEEIARVRAKA